MNSLALISLIALLGGQDTSTFDKAWRYEQDARNKANAVIDDPKSNTGQVSAAINDLLKLIDFTKRPEIEAYKDGLGGPAFVYQRNDINMDLIGGYARLKDTDNIAKCIRAIRTALDGPQAPPNVPGSFRYYATTLDNDSALKRLLPNPEIETELKLFRLRNPERMLRGYAFSVDESPSISEADRIAGVSYIWSEAKYNFANFDLIPEVNWDDEYNRILPRAIRAKSTYDYYNVLRELMAKLKDSHTDVTMPASLRSQFEYPAPVRTALVEGKVVVTRIPPSGSCSDSLAVGDVIEKIDGVDAVEYGVKRWDRVTGSSTPQDRNVRLYNYLLLRGPKGKDAVLTVTTKDGSSKVVRAFRKPFSGVGVPAYSFRVTADGVAIFSFNTCGNNSPVDGFTKSLPEIKKAGKLIIDVRVNDGGSSSVGDAILSQCLEKAGMGTTWQTPQYRAAYRPWGTDQKPFLGTPDIIPAGKDPFLGPIVVLTSPVTFSAGEDFVAACRISKRVTIVGEATGGSTGQPLSFRLPSGGFGRICAKRDRFPDGTEFVGKGLFPDVTVKPTIRGMQEGRDVQLEKAIEVLKKLE